MSAMRVSVSCTDRGQHDWTALGDVVLDGGLLRANIGAVYGELAERRKEECVVVDGQGRLVMRCPRCRRNPQLTAENARNVIKTLWNADHGGGMAKLDISHLP